jgi:hypothetical protein
MQFPLPFQSPEEKSGGFSLASGLMKESFEYLLLLGNAATPDETKRIIAQR